MIAIGCDHGGLNLKKAITAYFDANGIEYTDYGTNTEDSVDYAPIGARVAHSVAAGENQYGILCCGTGIGISLAANKVKGIRAAVCTDAYCTEMTRRHNNANILCMGGRVISPETAVELTKIFLKTPFEGGRHQRRIDQIADIENGKL